MGIDIRVISEESAELETLRALFREYNDFLGFDLGFQDFETELAKLPGKYGAPSGRLYLAVMDGEAAGCAAFYQLKENICELKRLYVRPDFSGQGLGRALMQHALEDAKTLGYQEMWLDSLERLENARPLYEKFGFEEIAPYNFNPFDDVYYMARKL